MNNLLENIVIVVFVIIITVIVTAKNKGGERW